MSTGSLCFGLYDKIEIKSFSGRYLDTKNEIAKRNICASLLALFRKQKAVESANEMNFLNVIEQHIEVCIIRRKFHS